MLAALLVAAAGAGLARSRRAPEIRRLLDPHVKRRDHQEAKAEQKKLFEPVFDWTEDALADLPGSGRLTRLLERSGLRLRPGHVPFLCLAGALVFGALGTALAVGSGASLVLMLLGFTSPLIVVHRHCDTPREGVRPSVARPACDGRLDAPGRPRPADGVARSCR